jgi:hypothetical protein
MNKQDTTTTTHPAYDAFQPRWEKNRDFCGGEMAVKARGRRYLPDDNEDYIGSKPQGRSIKGPDSDPAKFERKYQVYLRRASLLAIAQHTRNGFVGMVFSKDHTVELPSVLEYIQENVDGAGQSLDQLAQSSVSEVVEVGRMGLLVDMPTTDENLSLKAETELGLKPRILQYDAESIVDWGTDTFGGITKLTFVKLRECYYDRTDDEDDLSAYSDVKTRYRILRLNDGVYTQQVIEDDGEVGEELTPRMSGNASFDYIPFFFVGAQNNKPDVDEAPISGIVDINAAHYINSADNEQLIHMYSLATPHLNIGDTSLTEWNEGNPNGVQAGNGFVTKGGSFELAQIEANSALSEALKDKEAQAEKIGARFAGEGNSKDVTAEAARINAAFTTSTLSTLVGNVSEAIEAALEACAQFLGDTGESVEYQLNKQFYGQEPNIELARFYTELYDLGRLSSSNYTDLMREINIELDGDFG